MTCGCVEACCQIVSNWTPEIVKYTPGFSGELIVKIGCETMNYIPGGAALVIALLSAFLGLVVGWVIFSVPEGKR